MRGPALALALALVLTGPARAQGGPQSPSAKALAAGDAHLAKKKKIESSFASTRFVVRSSGWSALRVVPLSKEKRYALVAESARSVLDASNRPMTEVRTRLDAQVDASLRLLWVAETEFGRLDGQRIDRGWLAEKTGETWTLRQRVGADVSALEPVEQLPAALAPLELELYFPRAMRDLDQDEATAFRQLDLRGGRLAYLTLQRRAPQSMPTHGKAFVGYLLEGTRHIGNDTPPVKLVCDARTGEAVAFDTSGEYLKDEIEYATQRPTTLDPRPLADHLEPGAFALDKQGAKRRPVDTTSPVALALGRLLHVPPRYAADERVELTYDFYATRDQRKDFTFANFERADDAGPGLALLAKDGELGHLEHCLELVPPYEIRIAVGGPPEAPRSDLVVQFGHGGVRCDGELVEIQENGFRVVQAPPQAGAKGREVRIVVTDEQVVVSIDGKEVNRTTELAGKLRGRMGLWLTNARVSFRDVTIKGKFDPSKL